MRTPLLDPAVQLSVPFNGAKEVWIGKRGIGPGGTRFPGSGSKVDPFDGTDQALFDAIMTTYKAVPGTIINLHDGGYSSNFAWGTSVAAGVKIIGSSGNPRDTVITNTTKVGRLISLIGDDCHAEGFTVDCNGLGVTTTSAVATRGNNPIMRKLRVTRPCDGSQECFAIAMFADTTSISNGLIEYCEVDNFIGVSGTMIMIGKATDDPAVLVINGIARHNNVHDGDCNAYGSGGTVDAKFHDNYSLNTKRGFNRDSWACSGHELSRNRFLKVTQTGISLWGSGTPAYDDRVTDNIVSIIPVDATKQAYYLRADLNGLLATGNKAYFVAGGAVYCFGFLLQAVSGLIAVGNRASVEFRNTFINTDGSPPALLYDNTGLDGGAMYRNQITVSPRTLVPYNIHIPSLARRFDILPSSLLDPDVSAMRALIPSDSTISDTSVGLLNDLVKGLRSDDEVWDKFYEVYPFCGDFGAVFLKLKYAGIDYILENNGFVIGNYNETGVTGGLKGAGGATNSQWLDSLFNPVEHGASLTDFALGVYVAGAPVPGTSSTEMGSLTAAGESTRLGWGNTGSREIGEIGSVSQANAGAVAFEGMLIVTCNGDRTLRYYHDGVEVATGAGTNPGAFDDASIFIGAQRSAGGSAINPMVRYLRLGFISRGLSVGDVESITDRVLTYQTGLTRNV